jgi:hypothetical protein
MNCSEVQFKISEWVDGEALEHESGIQRHMKFCKDCASFYQDLQRLKENSGQLGLFDPPGHLWMHLREQLVAEGLIHAQEPSKGLWERIFPAGLSGLWPGLKPALTGAILALVLSATVLYFYTRSGKEGPPTEVVILQELQQAERHYQRAIETLSEVSQRKIEGLDPAMAQILNDNLATMDYYVKECQEAVKNNPGNPLVHRYLLTAYQKKVEIMQSIMNSDVL